MLRNLTPMHDQKAEYSFPFPIVLRHNLQRLLDIKLLLWAVSAGGAV